MESGTKRFGMVLWCVAVYGGNDSDSRAGESVCAHCLYPQSIPATKALAIPAVIDGGGIIHRGGTAETILLFANHRRFFADPDDWITMISRLRMEAPEKKIIVEADTVEEALAALQGQPDVLQLDKFSLSEIRRLRATVEERASNCLLSIAGGIHRDNVSDYAATGVSLIVTSSPYYAEPADIKVVLQPA